MVKRFLAILIVAGANLMAAANRIPSAQRCDQVGEVIQRNAFAQTFLLKLDADGQAAIPYSRWTQFLRGSKPGIESAEIEPTDIRTGDRLCVMLDPSGSTSSVLFVIEQLQRISRRSQVEDSH